ncbi:MAG: hypothetical protein GYB67_17680 [Chloroflexi bacterium]|nr:hypothetical protein [Chloroflexota bacterium]
METPSAYHDAQPPAYEILIEGQLDNGWVEWLEGLTITTEAGFTRLHGPLADQAALLGVLKKLHNLGLTLISVTRLTPGTGSAGSGEVRRSKHA